MISRINNKACSLRAHSNPAGTTQEARGDAHLPFPAFRQPGMKLEIEKEKQSRAYTALSDRSRVLSPFAQEGAALYPPRGHNALYPIHRHGGKLANERRGQGFLRTV